MCRLTKALGLHTTYLTENFAFGFSSIAEFFYLAQRAVQLNEEEDISSIYQMPDINPRILRERGARRC